MDNYEADGSNAGGYADDDGLGADNVFGSRFPTRDFLSQPPAFSLDAGYNTYTGGGYGMPASSSQNPSRLDFGGLDLNSGGDGWSDMQGYQELLRTGGVEGSHGPPPVRVPPRSANRTLGFRGARNGQGGGGSASVRGGRSPFVGAGFNPTMAREGEAPSAAIGRPRRRGGRRRAAAVNIFPHAVCCAMIFCCCLWPNFLPSDCNTMCSHFPSFVHVIMHDLG
jgi:hypothetical protein